MTLLRMRALRVQALGLRAVLVMLITMLGNTAALASTPTLVLVSIDGFRHDYLDIHAAPNLNAMAQHGVRVTRLKPIYPPNTFPGHLSLITGVAPASHGIVDNSFCHRTRGDCYRMGMGARDASWLKATPLWNWVQAQGFKAATYFWPESEAQWGGATPDYFFSYNKATPYDDRVRQVLQWLALPDMERPRLITLYFSAVDSAGHAYGPLSKETAQAIARVDAHIGDLISGIQALGPNSANVLVVSDHGMAEISGAHTIDVSELPDPQDFQRFVSHARVRYYARDPVSEQGTQALVKALQEQSKGRWQTLTASQVLALGGADDATVADIVIATQAPRSFTRESMAATATQGGHGYLLSNTDMDAFVLGYGPAFHAGLVIPEAHQLDIFPFAATLMHLPPPAGLPSNGGTLLKALH